MRGLVREYKKNPHIIQFSRGVVSGIPGKSWMAEVRACYFYVVNNIRYTQDPNGVEMLQTPVATLEIEQGDCDDMCVLLASLLEALGHPTRFVAASFDATQPDTFSHVFLQTITPDCNRWLSLDPTEPEEKIGWQPPDIVRWLIRDN